MSQVEWLLFLLRSPIVNTGHLIINVTKVTKGQFRSHLFPDFLKGLSQFQLLPE